jgi:two-component system, response regulator / RNA-binding antiterminator
MPRELAWHAVCKVKPMNVLLLWEPGEEAQALALALARVQCTVVGPYAPNAPNIDLQEILDLSQADLIIINTDAAERDTLEHFVVASQTAPRPIVMVTDGEGGNTTHSAHTARLAAAAGISAYVCLGLEPARIASVLQVATAQFEGQEAGNAKARAELAAVRLELQERKQVERAKGWLMQHFKITEDEAYRRLRVAAMQRQTKIGEIAKELMNTMGAPLA